MRETCSHQHFCFGLACFVHDFVPFLSSPFFFGFTPLSERPSYLGVGPPLGAKLTASLFFLLPFDFIG